MTSCFYAMGPVGQNQAQRYFEEWFDRWQYQLDVRQLQQLVEFISKRHRREGKVCYL